MASELEVGKLGAGVAPAAPLHAKVAATTGSSPLEVARLEVKDEGVNLVAGMGPKQSFFMPHSTASFEGASIAAKKETGTDADESTSLVFSTCPDAGTNTERLTINSSGQALFSGSRVTINTDGTIDWGNPANYGRLTWDGNDAKIRGVSGKNLKLGANNTDYVTIDTSGLATFSNGITVSGGLTSLGDFSAVTIVGGGITVTSSAVRLATQGGASTDDLLGISGGTDGSILVLQSVTSSNTVVVKHSTGGTGENIRLAGGADFSLDNSNDVLVLVKYGTNWREVSRSNNS